MATLRSIFLSAGLPIALLLAVMPVPLGAAQGLEVSGRVMTAPDSLPRGGVSVRVKGAETGVLSNSRGEYRITAPNPTDTLVFTFLGYETLEVPVVADQPLNVALVPALLDLEDITISIGTFGSSGPQVRPNPCQRTYSPMPGSAFDPNWQRENPELARLMAPGCTQATPRLEIRPLPSAPRIPAPLPPAAPLPPTAPLPPPAD